MLDTRLSSWKGCTWLAYDSIVLPGNAPRGAVTRMSTDTCRDALCLQGSAQIPLILPHETSFRINSDSRLSVKSDSVLL